MQYDLFGNAEEVDETPLTEVEKFFKLSVHIDNNRAQAEEFDFLALEYKDPMTRDKRKGAIYLLVKKRFDNLVKQKLGKFLKGRQYSKSDYFDEGMAIWTRMIGQKLNEWDGVGTKHPYLNFLAYLYPYANRGVVSELNEKIVYKNGRYSSTDENEGCVDALNTLSSDDSSWQGYELALMASAFKGNVIEVNDLESACNQAIATDAIKEIDYYYDGVNRNQWASLSGSHKNK